MPRWVDPVPALKRQLADEILALSSGWSQTWAAWAMHTTQSRVSDLRAGKVDTISLERLVQCLSHLGRDVEVKTTLRLGPRLARVRQARAGGRVPESSYPELDGRDK